MYTRGDIVNISNAAKASSALSQVRNRENGLVSSAQIQATGDRYKLDSQKERLPIYDQNGKIFAGPLLTKDKTLTLPSNVETGNIVEYLDKDTGEYYYGKVVSSKKKDKLTVKNVSKKEVDSDLIKNPKTRVYSLGKDDLSYHKDNGVITVLMGMLDPSENVVFKLMTLLLIGNIFETDSLSDVFFGVYIRVISLAVGIIAVIYISTTYFG